MLHGICILIHRVWKNGGRKLNKLVGWFITMNLVNIFWVFFRAETVLSAMKVIKGMGDIISIQLGVGLNYRSAAYSLFTFNGLILVLIIGCILILSKNSNEKQKLMNKKRFFKEIELIFYFLFSIFFITRVETFLYFNF